MQNIMFYVTFFPSLISFIVIFPEAYIEVRLREGFIKLWHRAKFLSVDDSAHSLNQNLGERTGVVCSKQYGWSVTTCL